MKKYLSITFVLLGLAATSNAQTPTDLDFVNGGSICVAAGYNYSAWNKYWQGENLIENGNVGTVSTQQVGLGFNLGIIDRLNVIVQLPYIITHPNQGTLKGQHGLQDIKLNLKGNYGELKIGSGTLKLAGVLGFSTPVSDYLVDFAPLNLGSGTTNFSYRQLLQYKLQKGFYAELKGNYTLRSNIPSIHRDFYYDEGNAYYENEVHVPDVFDWAAAVGFSNEHVLGEVVFSSYNTLGGSDIRNWDPGFPTNNTDANVISGRFNYYFSNPAGLQLVAKAGYTVSGRNAGQSWFGNVGVAYLFPVWGKNHDH